MIASERTRTWVVALIGLAMATGLTLKILLPSRMDPSVFLALGEQAPIQTDYARELLGEVTPRHLLGHDGKYFFAQANDPWYLDPEMHASVIDRPILRGQRMLYPMLAGGFGLFPPRVVVWAMLVTNLLAIGLGSLVAARLAVFWGASPWLGLAVPLNLGLIFEIYVGGAGVVAFVLCLASVFALVRGQPWTAAVLLAGAALSREVMLIFALGVFVSRWIDEQRPTWRLVALPVLASVIWQLYLRYRLMGVSGVGGGLVIFAAPFTGMWQALRDWSDHPDDLVFNGAMVVLMIAFTIRALRSRLPLAWGALPFVFLTSILSVHVWREPFDLARALAPVFTAAAFLIFVREKEDGPVVSQRSHAPLDRLDRPGRQAGSLAADSPARHDDESFARRASE